MSKRAYAALSGPNYAPINAVKYDYTAGQRVAVGSVSAASAVVDADNERLIRIVATVDIYIAVAADPTAADAAGSSVIPAGSAWHEIIPAGHKIAVLRAGLEDGAVFITPVVVVQ